MKAHPNDGLVWCFGGPKIKAHRPGCGAIRGLCVTDPEDKAEAIRVNDPASPDFGKPVAWDVIVCRCVAAR